MSDDFAKKTKKIKLKMKWKMLDGGGCCFVSVIYTDSIKGLIACF